MNPLKRWNPIRNVFLKYNASIMDKFLDKELDKYLLEPSLDSAMRKHLDSKTGRSIIELATDTYLKSEAMNESRDKMDAEFRVFAKTQIRTFLFAGHDSTSSAMCSTLYLLFKNREALDKIRAEHDSVFGQDKLNAAELLSQEPQLINKVPYTGAVIKEALRMFPPSSSMREGSPDYSIVGPAGSSYPTECMLVWVMHQALHRNSTYWVRADEFLPERWLVGSDHPLHPIKDAWRPFEYGPRNCLGQEVAMLELKVVLILVCRRFNIISAYDEWDALNPKSGPRTVEGDRMYQVERVAARPVNGFPCKVQQRN